jgi:hypothetical protein
MRATTLQDLRRVLPAMQEQKSALDKIVEQMTAATGFNGLSDKLQRWGWTDEFGNSVTWQRWYKARFAR